MYTLKKEGRLRVVYCAFGTQKSKKQLLPLGKNVDFRKAARIMEILFKANSNDCYSSSHNHGAVENYPKGKESTSMIVEAKVVQKKRIWVLIDQSLP